MAILMVRAWRGLNRARLLLANKTMNALLHWNTKNPTAGLFLSSEVIIIQETITIFAAKLAATKPR